MINPHDNMDNYEIFKTLTRVKEEDFGREDMLAAIDKTVPFIDDHLFEIRTMADRFSSFTIANIEGEWTTPRVMRLLTLSPMAISYLMGYAMGKQAEKQNLTLEKILAGFTINLEE